MGDSAEAQEKNKEKDPVRTELPREIAIIQIQTYINNLALGRIEQTLKELKWRIEQWSEMPGFNFMKPAQEKIEKINPHLRI